MTRLSHTVIQTLVLGTCMAGMRLLYLRTVEFAWPDPAAARIDWVGIYGQVLSIFVFLEGTLVILRSSLKRRPLRRSSGIIFIMLCTCYMCAYATLKAASAGLCWQFGGILRGAGLGLPHAIAYDLLLTWSSDWEQLGCLAIPAVFVARLLPSTPKEDAVEGSVLLGSVGWLLILLLTFGAVVHEVYRPWGLH